MKYVDRILTEDHHDRVRALTSRKINYKIDMKTKQKINEAKALGPRAVQARLQQLDREWDINKLFMVNFSIIVFTELLLARKNRKWLWVPIVQTPFLFMQAALGWSPPSLWFRLLGIRTSKEIQAEREALLSNLNT